MIRLVDAGTVSALRSQALYHGLAAARTAATPDTVVLAVPADPYVCIGYHQDPDRELDLDACRALRLPVVRRRTGGGAVLLDGRQLFAQWIMAPQRLPPRLDRRFELFCGPLVATYRDFGIAARFAPPNDVHAGDRKISGTGAAQIGAAEVLTGNLLLDFDADAMARIVRAPSPAFRAQVTAAMRRYLTSMRRELGSAPAAAAVADRYVGHCAAALGPLVPGPLTGAELEAIAASERELGDPAFTARPGGLRRPGVKIHADVHVVETAGEIAGSPVRITARLQRGRIEEIELRGAAPLDALAAALRGVPLAPEPLQRALAGAPDGPALPADWTRALLALRDPDRSPGDRP